MNRPSACLTVSRLIGGASGRRLGALLCALLVPTLAAAREKPTRAEIGKRGKAATALVVNGPRTGSAFCVHPAGLFVTNEHVVRDVSGGKGLKVVLDAALKTQRVLEARVVRSDAALDLALLRVEGAKPFPALPIGDSDGVVELAELIAFGFPFGTALSPDRKEYPSISVNVCTVSALRRKGGEVDRIDLNGAVNPGQSGGPILDQEGKVVGVIVSGIRGSGIAQAIPSALLSRFLEKPEITFTPPRLDAAASGKPVTFQVRVDSPLAAGKPPEVELTLTGQGSPRRQKMELRDGLYQATLVPAPPSKGPSPLEVTARFPGGTVVVSPVADRPLKAGGKPVALKDVSRVRLGEGAQVWRTDGTTLAGPLEGLEAVEVRIGGQAVTLDLGKAESLEVAQPGALTQFDVTFVVTVAGKEVGRTTAAVPIGATGTAPAAVAALKPAALGAGRTVKKLPGAFSDVALGGNGRYLILSLPRQRQLAVFDVTAARLAGFIPIEEGEVKFAAGMDKLVVGLPTKGVLERWDLATIKRELTVRAGPGVLKHVALGHASAGPVLVHYVNNPGVHSERTEFLDLRSLRPLTLRDVGGRGGIGVDMDAYVRASADGQTFTFWRFGSSPQGVSTLVLQGNDVRRYDDHHSAGHLLPSPDGKVIYTARGRYTSECKALDDPRNGYNYTNYMLPAVQGNYHLGISPADHGKGLVDVYLGEEKRPVARLKILDGLPEANAWGREAVGLDKRLFFIPDAKVVVTLPRTNDEVVLHRFDVEEELEKSGVDYLLVTSTPPATARRGAEFRYRVTARAKKGGVTFTLSSGPEGLRVSPDGTVTWKVPADPDLKEANVVITVRDAAGQETFHTFTLKLE